MKKIILCLVAVFGVTFLAMPSLVSAQDAPPVTPQSSAKSAVCDGLGQLGGSTDPCSEKDDKTGVLPTIKAGINLLSIVVGVAAVIMIMIGGFKYVTSGGDSARVNSAKDTILYAIIGLVVVALAQFVVRFVVARATKPPAPAKTQTSLRLVVKSLADTNRDMV